MAKPAVKHSSMLGGYFTETKRYSSPFEIPFCCFLLLNTLLICISVANALPISKIMNMPWTSYPVRPYIRAIPNRNCLIYSVPDAASKEERERVEESEGERL